MQDDERITLRDDLDGIDDDETLVEDPDVRRAKTFLFLVTFLLLSGVIVVLLVFFQPEGVEMTRSWPNGYARIKANYVSASNDEGRVLHGLYREWHQSGQRAARGHYEHGVQVGPWRYWSADGTPDDARTGVYADGQRVSALGE